MWSGTELVLFMVVEKQMIIHGRVGGWQEESCRGVRMERVYKSMMSCVGPSQPNKRTRSKDPMASRDVGSSVLPLNQPASPNASQRSHSILEKWLLEFGQEGIE